jgi:hypothetical protein
VTEAEEPVRLVFHRLGEDGMWMLARSDYDAEHGYELPDGPEKLYAVLGNLLHLVSSTARPFLAACYNDRENPDPLTTDRQRFEADLWAMCSLCDEGWRLLREYEQHLACAAGGVVNACSISGTSAHEVALKLADYVICTIMRGAEIGFPSRRSSKPSSFLLDLYLRSLDNDQFLKEVEEIPKRTEFIDKSQLDLLSSQLRSEHLILTSRLSAIAMPEQRRQEDRLAESLGKSHDTPTRQTNRFNVYDMASGNILTFDGAGAQSWGPVHEAERASHKERKIQQALQLIDKRGPIKGVRIARELGICESTFRKHYVPLLEERGVRNDRSGNGYYRSKDDGGV